MNYKICRAGVSVLTIFSIVVTPLFMAVPTASADFLTGDGTARNPYEILNCTDITEINTDADTLAADYLLMQDLDCSANGNEIMIGGSETPYIGEFDGQGHTITVDIDVTGVDAEDVSDDYVGLFRAVADVSIEDLAVAGTVTSTGDYVGGLVGDVGGASSIRRVISSVTVTGDNYVGGIAGALRIDSELENAYATGDVTSVYGIDASVYTGGLVGYFSDSALIENSYSSGAVHGYEYVGGLVGQITEGTDFYNNFSVSSVQGDALDGSKGGVVGYLNGEAFYIGNNYYDIDASTLGADLCAPLADILGGCEGVDTSGEGGAHFYLQDNVPFTYAEATEWNNSREPSVWRFSGEGYPTLWGFVEMAGFEGEGEGTEESPYIVSTCEDITSINSDLDAHYSLVLDDENATELDCTESGNDIMVRSNIDYFTGSFDGNDINIIVDIDFDGSFVGLFAKADRAELVDVVVGGTVIGAGEFIGSVAGYIEDSVITGSSSSADVTNLGFEEDGEDTGGFAGQIENCAVDDSFATGNVEADLTIDVGGFAGDIDNSDVTNSYATGDVSAEGYVGGFVGDSDDASFDEVYATGDVTGTGNRVGGLMGGIIGSTLNQSYATGAVNGDNDYVGGLVGWVVDTTIYDSYATGDVVGSEAVGGLTGLIDEASDLERTYSVGLVTGATDVGGLIGSSVDSEVDYSFWDLETSAQEESAAGTGMSTLQMKDVATFTTDLGEDSWDFDIIWGIHSGLNNGYPYLLSQGLVEPEVVSRGGGSGSRVNKVEELTYEQEVARVLELGIVTENPTSETNKCEALIMMSRVFEWQVPASSSTQYTDVPTWCTDVAAFGTERGIVEGRTETTLGMDTNVTRYEVVTMLFRELGIRNWKFEGTQAVEFSDELIAWAKEAVLALAKEGIVNGFSNGTFGGSKGILKQDLGVMLIRI